jgi:DNA-directed RNA polymerase specialized sigma24 family protein
VSPAEPQHSARKRDEFKTGSRSGTARGQWSLTAEAFNNLLAALSPNREEAAQAYEVLRYKLIRFFESRSVTLAENRADEVLNRIAKRIDEGQHVDNVTAYGYRVAYLVFLETLKEPEHTEIDLDAAPPSAQATQFEDDEHEQRQRCFDRCLNALPADNRRMILSYYQEERRAKIEMRRNLATQMTISLDALRIRVHRIRKGLEECITHCLHQPA